MFSKSLDDFTHSDEADRALALAVQYNMYPVRSKQFPAGPRTHFDVFSAGTKRIVLQRCHAFSLRRRWRWRGREPHRDVTGGGPGTITSNSPRPCTKMQTAVRSSHRTLHTGTLHGRNGRSYELYRCIRRVVDAISNFTSIGK